MFVFGVLLAAVALFALATVVFGKADRVRRGAWATFAVGLFLSLAFVVGSCVSVVPTRNVGIVTSWGKPTGRTTGAGLQWTAPWQDIDEWDASGQTYAHLGDHCVWVTIAAQRRACIPVQIEWSAKSEKAPENWAAYREVGDKTRFEVFVERRVNPQINGSLTSIFAAFDPLGSVDVTSGDAPAPDLNKTYKEPLVKALNTALGDEIVVKSVAFESPRYDEPTTQAIAAYGQKILEARNLEIDKANAKTRAEITRTDASVDQVARCLQIAEKLGKEPGLCMGGSVSLTRPVQAD
ncbi:SPFH domain-containing protein [Actinoplanes sp. NPDC049802]|uniref:SPFH domain-containing protein n=1 Tax=Actinoplanes sp. NPDC049802 TaxID=3154742 RepID=UPI0033F8B160